VSFIIELLNGFAVCVVVLSPVVFGLSVAIHEYVEVTLLVKGMLTVPPLHTDAVIELVMIGTGITVTVTVCEIPAQVPPITVGVTV
jgi:hypothetical protein